MLAWLLILSVPAAIIFLIIWDAERANDQTGNRGGSPTNAIAFASAAGAVISALFAGISYFVTTELTEKSLVMANRPWIKVDIQVAGPITYNDNGANFTLKYILKNIGRSPAVNVEVHPRIIFPIVSVDQFGEFNARRELLKDISARKAIRSTAFGYSLFPDDTMVQDITVSMSKEDIHRATKLVGAIYPRIVGTVTYRMGFDNDPHQTAFLVELRRNDVPRPTTIEKNRWAAAIWIDEGEVPAADVRLYRSFFEGGYAD
jgi:hypothetical protein